jgi:hypothetical protein
MARQLRIEVSLGGESELGGDDAEACLKVLQDAPAEEEAADEVCTQTLTSN